MALKITGKASGIPGGPAAPSVDRGPLRPPTVRAPADGAGLVNTRLSIAGPMAPKNAVAARLRHASRTTHPPEPPTLPQPLATPLPRPRRRPQLGTGAAAHPDEAQDLFDVDEQRALGETDEPQAGAPRRAGGLAPAHRAASDEPGPPARANGAQAARLQLGALAAIGSARRATPAGARIPHDGNSFMNSLVHTAAAMLRRNIALPSSAPLSAPMLRKHMAIHMIDVFVARNADAANPHGLAGEPYGAGAANDRGHDAYDFGKPQVRRLLDAALGEHHAARCDGLSAAQKSQVLDMAADRPALLGPRRALAFAAILPQVATEAFEGLRLEVRTRGREPVVHGNGDGPVHALAFNGLSGRYEPV